MGGGGVLRITIFKMPSPKLASRRGLIPDIISMVVIIGREFNGVLVSGIIAMKQTIAIDSPCGYPSSLKILTVISSATPSPNIRIPVIARAISRKNCTNVSNLRKTGGVGETYSKPISNVDGPVVLLWVPHVLVDIWKHAVASPRRHQEPETQRNCPPCLW